MRRPRGSSALYRAFDEAQFGDARTLNLRDGLPSGTEAAARADAWLRLKQVEGAREVLIVTGRGANSVGAVPVVRTHVAQRLARLRRAGIVAGISEHTPGSWVVKLVPVSAMLANDRAVLPARPRLDAAHPALAGLTSQTRRLVHDMALRTLESLGIRATTRAIVADEMERQIVLLSRAMPHDADRDQWIRDAAQRALSDSESTFG